MQLASYPGSFLDQPDNEVSVISRKKGKRRKNKKAFSKECRNGRRKDGDHFTEVRLRMCIRFIHSERHFLCSSLYSLIVCPHSENYVYMCACPFLTDGRLRQRWNYEKFYHPSRWTVIQRSALISTLPHSLVLPYVCPPHLQLSLTVLHVLAGMMSHTQC